jgi:Cytochrome P450
MAGERDNFPSVMLLIFLNRGRPQAIITALMRRLQLDESLRDVLGLIVHSRDEEDKRTPYGLVTFGSGPRLCIGIHFATIEVKVLAAYVLRSCCLEPISEQPPEQAGFIATIIPNGISMRVRPLTATTHRAA